jgi:hypothetical protein
VDARVDAAAEIFVEDGYGKVPSERRRCAGEVWLGARGSSGPSPPEPPESGFAESISASQISSSLSMVQSASKPTVGCERKACPGSEPSVDVSAIDVNRFESAGEVVVRARGGEGGIEEEMERGSRNGWEDVCLALR